MYINKKTSRQYVTIVPTISISALYKGYFQGNRVQLPPPPPGGDLEDQCTTAPGISCNTTDCAGLVMNTNTSLFIEKLIDINLNSFVAHDTIQTLFNFNVDGANVRKTSK